jgi:hypothetical protein
MTNTIQQHDVIIIGAGAAGLMCASAAGKRGRNTLVLEHNDQVGKKILISGGGRCNFTNLDITPDNYLCENPHFHKSALSRYTQWDFLELIAKHNVPYHEKKLGQLFCDNSASDIVALLVNECNDNVDIATHQKVVNVEKQDDGQFLVSTEANQYASESLVIASGALSFPRLGVSDIGYRIAEQFDLALVNREPGLVPFTFEKERKKHYEELSGIALDALVTCNNQSFRENVLFTHKGLSGPAILQVSSYWRAGHTLSITFLPDVCLEDELAEAIKNTPKVHLKNWLNQHLPKRFVELIMALTQLTDTNLASLSNAQKQAVLSLIQPWNLVPAGTEGYKKAEVTLGGIDTDELSSKTLESKKVPGLYCIGEVVDVTGHLGGYNFQWAWSSGYCAGQYV